MQVINISNKREFFTTDPIILKNNNLKNYYEQLFSQKFGNFR